MKENNNLRAMMSFTIITAILLGVCSAAALVSTDGRLSTDAGVWTNISEEYYAPISIGGGEQLLLYKTLQESDYAQILEMLVDTSIPADTAAVEKVAADPDAHLPDNMLPDGRVLRSDWQTAQQTLIESAQEIALLSNNNIVTANAKSQMSISVDDSNYKMDVFTIDGQKYILPEIGTRNCEVIPETHESVFYDEHGIWLVNPQTRQTTELLPDMYKGKTYDELSAQAAMNGNQNGLVWSNQVCVNEAGTKLAYISDKENLSTYSVFMYDIETNEENLVKTSTDYNYLMIGWISEDTVLCYKLKGLGLNVVAIDDEGNEQAISFETDDPNIIDISGDLIAYRGPGSHDVWISRYDGTANPELVIHVALKDGVVCVMSNAQEFSPSGDKFAFIYSPSESSDSRYLWTIDLAASRINKEMSLPAIDSDTVGVHDFAWKNDTELVVNVYAQQQGDNETISTWNYTMRGGNQDATY